MLSSMPRSDCGRWLPIFALLWFVIGAPAVGDQTAQQKKPTGAVVDIEQSEFGAILESKLLSNDRVNWLERSQIDRILKERELTQLFSVDGAGQRKQLGQLLQANLLVLIRSLPAGEANQRRYDLAVCETSHGLRLFRTELIGTADIQADAEHVAESIVKCFDRVHMESTVLFAVPPFVSGDLELEFDYMKAAYAKLVEGQLLAQPGVLVVELDEALSIAREYRLASESARLQRLLPYYILGEYRHHNRPEGGSIDLSVTLRYGEQEIAKIQRTELKPNVAAEFLLTATTDMMSHTAIQPAKLKDAAIEAQILSERAKEFRKLGNFTEAIDLIEAALLLQPGDIELHQQALELYDRFCIDYRSIYNTNEERALQISRKLPRAIEHFEKIMVTFPKIVERYAQKGQGPRLLFTLDSLDRSIIEKVNLSQDSVTVQWKKSLLRITIQQAKSGYEGAEYFLQIATRSDREAGKYVEIERVIRELADEPGAVQRTKQFAKQWGSIEPLKTTNGLAFLERLAASEHISLKEAGQQMLEEIRSNPKKTPRAKWHPRQDDPNNDPREIEFERLHIRVTSSDRWLKGNELTHISGCLPIAPNIDLIWMRHLYLMKRQGVAEEVKLPLEDGHVVDVKFDGKFVWIVIAKRDHKWRIVCYDPVTEQTQDISANAELPSYDSMSPFAGIQYLPISVAPIGPGRVCMVGSFGRAWIALVEVLPTGGTKVELIHEAREVFQPEDRKAYRNANVGFAPMLLETLVDPSDAKASPKVLIWRHEMEDNGAIVRSYPLLVDPDEKRAIVPNEAITAIRNDSKVIGVQDHAIFQIKPHPISREIILVRHQLPKLNARVIAENTPQGLIRVVENELHIIGQKWWTIDLNQPSVRERAFVPWDYTDPFRNPKKIWVLPSYVAEPPPKEYVLDEVFTSSHYGFLVNVRERMDGQSHVLTWPRTMIASLLPLTASDSDD